MDKRLIILLVIIFISISCFSATPPTNKSPNSIIDWTNNNFVASDSWTSSGTTQIYSLKSVGIGTNTPDINYKLNVFGNSYLDGEYLWLDKENNIYLRRGYGASYNLSIYCGDEEKIRCSGFSYSGLYGNWFINGSMALYGTYSNIAWYGTGSKIYSPSVDIIAINNNSNETIRFTDLNNVLIGKSIDNGIDKLQINGSANFTNYNKTRYNLKIPEFNDLEGLNIGLLESIGGNWSIATDTSEDYILCLTYCGNGICLAGTINNGYILKSSDYGNTWAIATDTNQSQIRRFTYCGNGICLAGTYPDGYILKSSDYGDTWVIATDTTESYITSLNYFGNGICLAGSNPNGYILKSSDYGDTWAIATDTTEGTISSINYCGNGIGIAGTSTNGYILKSSDYGDTWNIVYDSTENQIKNVLYCGNGICLAGTSPNGYILKSIDSGDTWGIASDTTEDNINSLTYCGNGICLAGTSPNGYILKTFDYGNTWNIATDTNISHIYSLKYCGNGICLAGTYPNGYILKSSEFNKFNW